MHEVCLSLGSNIGERDLLIRRAIALISERVGQVCRQSSFIETEPWGFTSSNKFLNVAVKCLTPLSPRDVLSATQQIERELGRKRKTRILKSKATRQYSDRPIDIDILLYDDITVDEPDLKIPHPLMYERDFVMIPLKEITDKRP